MASCRVALLGPSAVGKTAWVHRLRDDGDKEFVARHVTTLAMETSSIRVPTSDADPSCAAMVDMVDRSAALFIRKYVCNDMMPKPAGFIFMFDVMSKESFTEACVMLEDTMRLWMNSNSPVPIVLIGSKIDMEGKRVVTAAHAWDYAESLTNQKTRSENARAAVIATILCLQGPLKKNVASLIGRMLWNTRFSDAWNPEDCKVEKKGIDKHVSYFEISSKENRNLLQPLQKLVALIQLSRDKGN